jgi:hypothetical protein
MHESKLQTPRDTYVSFITLSLAVALSGCGSDAAQGNTMPLGGAGTGGASAPGGGGAAGLGTGGTQASGGSNLGGSASGGISAIGTGGQMNVGTGGVGAAGAGAGGTVGAGGAATGGASNGGSAGAGGAVVGGSDPTDLPKPKGTCAPFKTGDMTFAGQRVKIWAGTPAHGPLVIYWYATGSSTAEVTRGLGQAAITEITSQGGVVAAMYKTTAMGTNTGNNVWYTGDFDITDEVLACAIDQQHIDTRHIHALGFSAGGLQSGYMAYARSNYMASVVTYSGGSLTGTLKDPSNPPAAMCQHGDPGSDVVILDFATASANMEKDLKSKGGFAIDCNHGGGHMIPTAAVASSWQFLKDHPYKTKPDPYAGGIPSGFPTYCKIP